jgi:general secretion pathway protein L
MIFRDETSDWKQNMTGNVSRWWESLAAVLLTETDSLGVYMDRDSLTLAHVRKSLSGLQVHQVTTLPYDYGKLEDLAPVLRDTFFAWGLKSCPVSLAVSSDLAFFQRVTLPGAAAENLAQVVEYELDRFLPLPPDQLYYGFQVRENTGTEIHLMIAAVAKTQVAACLSLLTEATLRPVWVTIEPLAAGNAFALLGGKRMPDSWLLLHLEVDAFELTHIRSAVLQSFLQKRDLREPAFTKDLKAAIDGALASTPAPEVLCIYGIGGPDFNAGVLQQYDLDIMYPGHLALENPLPEMDREKALPAVGTALSCLGKLPMDINLLPSNERAPIKVGKFTTTMTLLIAFLSLAVLWGGSALIYKRVVLYQVNRQVDRIAPEARQVEHLLKESRDLAKQMESMRKIGQSTDKLQILKDLTRLIPDNTWIFSLRLHKQNLEISGLSQSASELIPRLEKSGWLQKTEFASPIVTDASKLEHFKIKAEIKGLEPTL